jgi:3-dehydroquinate dehydratase/shikimate dehydrogenase
MSRASLVATLTDSLASDGRELAALADAVEWLEVRADLVGDLDVGWLRDQFKGKFLYSIRSRSSGGHFAGSRQERRQRLLEAAQSYDLIELEADGDLDDELLNAIPTQRRLISWYGRADDAPALKAQFDRLSSVAARFYKLVPVTESYGGELRALAFLSSLRRSDTIIYTNGLLGFWNRLLAIRLGSPLIYGLAGGERRTEGEPTVNQLIDDYGLPEFSPVTEIYGIVGNPVFHSLSPRLHNAAYCRLGRPALFVPLRVDSFGDFWREVVEGGVLESFGVSIKGLTVASPHKESALLEAGAVSTMARRANAANILTRVNGHWRADTTDPQGVVNVICERGILINGRRAAVVGCGGAGRAVAAGLQRAGAEVTLVNRGMERGRLAVELLNLSFVTLSSFDVDGYSLIVNATPVGRDDDAQPFGTDKLREGAVVVDLVYGAKPTPLMTSARSIGCVAADGRDVLLAQVLRQFKLMTGREMPISLAREKLGWESEVEAASPA